MGLHHQYHLDLCADDEDPSQLIIRPGWDAPHVRCFPRTFCAWPCLLRQVGTVLGSPHDYVVAVLAYATPGSRQFSFQYLLLPPRSAPTAAPPGLTPQVLQRPPRPPTHRGMALAQMAGCGSRASAPSIFGAS